MKESHLLDQEKSMLHRGDFRHKSSEGKTAARGLTPPGDALSVVPDDAGEGNFFPKSIFSSPTLLVF